MSDAVATKELEHGKHNGRQNGASAAAPYTGRILRHPDHSIPVHVERALAEAQSARELARGIQRARALAARPNAEERRKLNELTGKALQVDMSALSKQAAQLQESYVGRVNRLHQTASEAEAISAAAYLGSHTEWDIQPPPVDHHFWWAYTSWFFERGLNADLLDDGLHIFGNVSYNGDDLIQFSVGGLAVFELQPSRRPSSASGSFNSEPRVELLGNIDGFTGIHHWLVAADDKWCKCRMSLRQSAYQIAFAGALVDLAGLTETRTLINEENQGRNVSVPLPGSVAMPAIQFGGNPNLSVFVELEVRFDIELEGFSYIGFSPEIPRPNSAGSVLVKTPQWEPIPA